MQRTKSKTDEQIKHEIESELKWDARTWDLDVKVKVSDGVVTLTGVIPSYAQKLAAQEAAHRIEGVLDVANELLVKIPRIFSDEEIARSVRQALEWDALVPDEQIESTVTDCWVRLEGAVNTLRQREDAEEVVSRIKGVIGVTNLLTVEPMRAKPEDLRREIEQALERRAVREADRLRIEVEDGAVNLYGRVHSWRERRAVVGSIFHAPGVKKINDHLRIEPYF